MKRCVKIEAEDCAEPGLLWALDDKENWEQLRHYILANWEGDGRETISVVELTPEEWDEASRLGKEE